MDNAQLCATRVKGQLHSMSWPDFVDIVQSSCMKTARVCLRKPASKQVSFTECYHVNRPRVYATSRRLDKFRVFNKPVFCNRAPVANFDQVKHNTFCTNIRSSLLAMTAAVYSETSSFVKNNLFVKCEYLFLQTDGDSSSFRQTRYVLLHYLNRDRMPCK